MTPRKANEAPQPHLLDDPIDPMDPLWLLTVSRLPKREVAVLDTSKKIVPLGSCPIWGQMSWSNLIYLVSVAYLYYYQGISVSFMSFRWISQSHPNVNKKDKSSTLSQKNGDSPRLLFLLLEFSQLLFLVTRPKAQWRFFTRLHVGHAPKLL